MKKQNPNLIMIVVLCLLISTFIFPTKTLADSTPATPTNLTASVVSSNQINLIWNPVNYASSYYVYRATSISGAFSKIATITTSVYTDTSVSVGVTYYYKVQAVNSAGTSSDSSIVNAIISSYSSAPAAPTNITASLAGSNQVYLSWDSSSNANFYYVFRATSPNGTYSIVGAPTTTSYSDSNLSLYTTYYYKLQAVGNMGASPDSAIVYATTTVSNNILSAPTNLTTAVISSNQIFLTWAPVNNAVYYSVYRSTSFSGTYNIIGVPTTANFTDSGAVQNTTYYYKVQAVGSSGTSSDSAVVYATTTNANGALSTPANLTASGEGNQIRLTWNSVSNATNYYVFRATSLSGTYLNIASIVTSSYTDASVSQNTTYYYKVQAVSSAGTSSDSSIAFANTSGTANSVPVTPTNLSALSVSRNQINLTWNPVNNATSYYVFRATSPSETYTNVAVITEANYSDSGLSQNATYYYKVQAANSFGQSAFSAVTSATTKSDDSSPPVSPAKIQTDRLAGKDMYDTCAEVVKAGWNTSYYAIVVSGENYTDALCSAPLAQKYNAPLLLTTKSTLSEPTKLQLSRLKVKSVIMIGGTGVISSAVEQTIKGLGIEVSRIAGSDRYDTSVKIAQSMGQFVDQAVLASGETFPDALSIAPIAAMKGIPILLTPKDNLPQSVKSYLTNNIKSTFVVGGTGVISDAVYNQLPSPQRFSGIDRYETNISIVKGFANELDFGTCYVSTGENYADALSGSALASLTNSPVILVSNPVSQATLDFLRGKLNNIQKEVIFGGTAVVPKSVITMIDERTDWPENLSTPTGVTATAINSGQIKLTWDGVSGATSYYVYGATSSSGTYTHIATITATSYTNTGLWADTTYYYKVQAVNSSGSSEYSLPAHAKTTE